MIRRSLLTAGLVLAAATHPASAGMYKWTDDEGTVHYSQQPPPDRQAETMKPPPPPPANRGYEPPKLSSGKEKPQEQNPAEDPELAKKREEMIKKNCDAARNNLKVYTAHRRIQEGDKDEVIVLDDEERQKRIKTSQEKIEKYCKE